MKIYKGDKMSKFDPRRPYGHIRGPFAEYPRARYSQGVYYYDAQRRCLNPEADAPEETDVIEDATKVLIDEAQKAADAALIKMQKAKANVENDPSRGNKGALTRATKAYDKAQAKLDKLLG